MLQNTVVAKKQLTANIKMVTVILFKTHVKLQLELAKKKNKHTGRFKFTHRSLFIIYKNKTWIGYFRYT